MDNKQFPEQENDSVLPEEMTEVPQDAEPEFLTAPVVGEEITADEHAMAWHGMTHPTDPEPVFDMTILDDPEFTEFTPETETSPEEDPLSEILEEEIPLDSALEDETFPDEDFREAGEEEGLYLAPFPMDTLRQYRKDEVHGNAYRRPEKYGILLDSTVREPFVRADKRK